MVFKTSARLIGHGNVTCAKSGLRWCSFFCFKKSCGWFSKEWNSWHLVVGTSGGFFFFQKSTASLWRNPWWDLWKKILSKFRNLEIFFSRVPEEITGWFLEKKNSKGIPVDRTYWGIHRKISAEWIAERIPGKHLTREKTICENNLKKQLMDRFLEQSFEHFWRNLRRNSPKTFRTNSWRNPSRVSLRINS